MPTHQLAQVSNNLNTAMALSAVHPEVTKFDAPVEKNGNF